MLDRQPETQPPGGWTLVIKETGGTVKASDFQQFVTKVNDMLKANGRPVLSWQAVYERVLNAQN